ncbi:MAG: DUF3105 domain-containing protein [Dehalococcoidia bacterium]
MYSRLTWMDWTMLSLIALLAAFHAATLGGVFRGEDAGTGPAFFDLSRLPEGNAPTGLREPTAADRAEADASPDLPGRFVPTQGKRHSGVWPGDRVPYCPQGEVRSDCYASLPPSSGLHAPVQRAVRLEDGSVTPLPPNPGVYEFNLPREAVPHLQEHAGVFVGYNCATDACLDIIPTLEALVIEELSVGARVIMARFSDLPPDTIGLASWTRVDTFDATEFDAVRISAFIKTHSCRFDPEGFCREDAPQS